MRLLFFFLILILFSWFGWCAEQILPHFTTINGWETHLTLHQAGSTTAFVQVTGFEDGGEKLGETHLSLDAGQSKRLRVDELLGLQEPFRGWLRIQDDGSGIQGIMTFTFQATGGSTSLPLCSPQSNVLSFSLLQHDADHQSGFAVLNPSDQAQSVSLRLFDAQGHLLETVQRVLDPREKWLAMTQDVFRTPLPPQSQLQARAPHPITGFALTFIHGNQQIVAVPATPMQNPLLDDLQTALASAYDGVDLGGVSLGIQIGNQPMVVATAGYADMEQQIAMRPFHSSQAGSITKTFVAAMIMDLAEDGILQLDQPLATWVPEFPNAQKITLRMLLNHTSGIPDYNTLEFYLTLLDTGYDHIWNTDELLSFMMSLPWEFEPGTNAAYSNTNYLLLSMCAQRATQSSLAQLLRQRIIQPLNLTHTFLRDMEPATAEMARGYYYDPKRDVFADAMTDLSHQVHGSCQLGDGGLATTPEDMIRFIRALFKGQLITKESLLAMQQTHPEFGWDYGLGLADMQEIFGMPCWGHNGAFIWGQGILCYFPEFDASIAMLWNVFSFDFQEDPSMFMELFAAGMNVLDQHLVLEKARHLW